MDFKKIGLLVFCLAQIATIECRTVSSSFTIPYIDNEKAYFLSCLNFSGDNLVGATRLDFFTDKAETERFGLSNIRITPDIFSFDGIFLELPSLKKPAALEKTIIPVFSGGLNFKTDCAYLSFNLINGFIPEIKTVLESQQISVYSDPLIGLGGSLGLYDFKLSFIYAENHANFDIEGTEVGDIDISGTIVCGEWKNFGLFYAASEGSTAVSAFALLTDRLGFSGLAAGIADVRGFGGWGKFGYEKKRFRAEIWSGFAFFWASKTFFTATYFYNTNELNKGGSWNGKLDWDPSIIFIVHPSVEWTFSDNFAIKIGRWIPYFSGWSIPGQADLGEQSRTTTGSDFSISSNNIKTIFFSGLDCSFIWQID